MKTTAFFVLALTALLLGQWQDAPRAQDRTPAAADGLGARPLRSTRVAEPDAPRPPGPQRQALVRPEGSGLAAPRAASEPASAAARPLAAQPSGIGGETPSSLAAGAATPTDWRDGALDLLSQIGLFCPAAGCDSLEDD